VLVLLWVVCFGLHVNEVARGRLARVPVWVWAPESGDSYPILRGFWPGTGAESSGLVIGDRLVRVGAVDLRGVGPIGFVARVYEAVGSDFRVPIAFVRAGEPGEVVLRLAPVLFPWRILPLILGFAATGVLAFLRAPGSRPARAYFLASLAYSLHWSLFFGGPRVQTYAWTAVFFCSSLVMFPLILRAVLLLPEELTSADARMPAWPWLFSGFAPLGASAIFGVPLPPTMGLHAVSVQLLWPDWGAGAGAHYRQSAQTDPPWGAQYWERRGVVADHRRVGAGDASVFPGHESGALAGLADCRV
jgi:hypothetical protein